MAKPISQSDTRWVKKPGKAGYDEQISTGKKVTGKVNIVENGSTTNVGGVADYRRGKNVTATTMMGQSKKKTGSKAQASKTPSSSPRSNVTKTNTTASNKPSANKPSANKPSANKSGMTSAQKMAARKSAADRAMKADKRSTGARTSVPGPALKAQSGYQAGKGQRVPASAIEQFGANVSRLLSSTSAREDAAKKAREKKAAANRAALRKKYGQY